MKLMFLNCRCDRVTQICAKETHLQVSTIVKSIIYTKRLAVPNLRIYVQIIAIKIKSVKWCFMLLNNEIIKYYGYNIKTFI